MRKLSIILLLALALTGCGKPPSGGGSPAPAPYYSITDHIFETDNIVLNLQGREVNENPFEFYLTYKPNDQHCKGKVFFNESVINFYDFNEEGCKEVNGLFDYKVVKECQNYYQDTVICGYNTDYDVVLNRVME